MEKNENFELQIEKEKLLERKYTLKSIIVEVEDRIADTQKFIQAIRHRDASFPVEVVPIMLAKEEGKLQSLYAIAKILYVSLTSVQRTEINFAKESRDEQ